MNDIAEIDSYLTESQPAAIDALCDLLRIESISTDPAYKLAVAKSAEWTANYLAQIGLKTEIWPTAGQSAVFAEWNGAASAPTVLIYGHHDVQPTGDLSKWASPPFEPRVDSTGRIFARGAADNKGQFFLQIRAVEAWLKTASTLPVNVKFLIEGEEEIGSPNLAALLQLKQKQLTCDLVVVSDTPLWRPGKPAISFGTRGITGLEVKVIGPNRDLHSGIFGGSVPNPIAVLCRMLAALQNAQKQVTVPGFYDDVVEMPRDLHEEWRAMESEIAREATDIACGFAGEADRSTLERRWSRPTLEFNGITGGYQGPGSNTIIPSWASAKITCRLVPNQNPDRIQQQLAEYLTSLCPPEVKLEFILRKTGARPYSIDPNHPALASAAKVLNDVYEVEPVRVREGLSLPILPLFKDVLAADTVLLGFCDPACNAHSFDEFFDSADLLRGARSAARFLQEVRPSLAKL